ncbi:hypothetical protein GGR52DRAFT_404943 [Hypoxylon sp. FL1284]|nr:hypothetical protein GGR52DRAFT_404943 [Hypoxylon sp. FL1284]
MTLDLLYEAPTERRAINHTHPEDNLQGLIQPLYPRGDIAYLLTYLHSSAFLAGTQARLDLDLVSTPRLRPPPPPPPEVGFLCRIVSRCDKPGTFLHDPCRRLGGNSGLVDASGVPGLKVGRFMSSAITRRALFFSDIASRAGLVVRRPVTRLALSSRKDPWQRQPQPADQSFGPPLSSHHVGIYPSALYSVTVTVVGLGLG